MNTIFKYSNKDLYLVAYTLVTLLIPFSLWAFDVDFTTLLMIIPFYSIFVLNGQNSALHYHTHWPTFNNKQYNNVYEIVSTIAYLLPQQWWKYAHMLHHKYNNDLPDEHGVCKDPTSIFTFGNNGQPTNFWHYSVKGGWYMFREYLFGEPWYIKKVPNVSTKLKREQLALKLFMTCMFILSIKLGIFIMLSFLLTCALNQAVSYGLHWEQAQFRGDTTRDSHSSYNKLYNIVSFNCGYHQEHHHKPNVHWTKLPTEVYPLIPQDRKTYILPAICNNPFWSHLILLIKMKTKRGIKH